MKLRIIAYGVIIGGGAGLTYELFHRALGSRGAVIPALIAIPVFGLLARFAVDSFDFWLRRDARDPNLIRQHEKKKGTPSPLSVMRKLFTILFSVLAILFSIGGAGALYDHVNYAYHLGPTGGYGGDSDAYGSFFGTGFSFIALVFSLLNFFVYPRSKVGVIILFWCGLLVVGFMTLRPRF